MKISDSRSTDYFNKDPLRVNGGVFYFLDLKSQQSTEETKLGVNALKTLLKKSPWVYNTLQWIMTPAFSLIGGLTNKKVLEKTFGAGNLKDKVIVNLGSGTKKLHDEITNVDIYPFKNVDVVADARDLPFKDGSVDLIICDSVLEHVPQAYQAIKEMSRVVKPGGYVYVTIPFLYPFHASPNDYYRWTLEGIKEEFKNFKLVKAGMRGGPMGALQGVLMHMLALPLSLGINSLYHTWVNVFMLLLSPLKLLDVFFLPFSKSHEIGAHLYFLGRKK